MGRAARQLTNVYSTRYAVCIIRLKGQITFFAGPGRSKCVASHNARPREQNEPKSATPSFGGNNSFLQLDVLQLTVCPVSLQMSHRARGPGPFSPLLSAGSKGVAHTGQYPKWPAMILKKKA